MISVNPFEILSCHDGHPFCFIYEYISTLFNPGSVEDPDPLVRGTDPDPDPSVTKQK